MTVIVDWAGMERTFHLGYGEVLDLEEACGKTPIGEIYARVASGRYYAREVYEVLRLGLIGGGLEPKEARDLVKARIDSQPFTRSWNAAVEVILSLMDGAPELRGDAPDDTPSPIDAGKVFDGFAQAGIDSNAVRAMRFGDVLATLDAARERTGGPLPPSAAEYEDMLDRLDGGDLAWATQPRAKT